jgi:hypothetical protein
MRSDMTQGAAFPDYELSDHTGKHRKLSELQGEDPMVVVRPRRLLSKGSSSGRGVAAAPSRDGGGLLPTGHDHNRQHQPDE